MDFTISGAQMIAEDLSSAHHDLSGDGHRLRPSAMFT
jgi:hypothetical protein